MTKLTERAEQRFAAIADSVEEAQSAVLTVQRRISEIEKQMRLISAETPPEERARFEYDLDRQRTRLQAAQGTFTEWSRLHTAIRSWLLQLPASAEFEDVPNLPYVELAAHETHLSVSVRIRCEIRDRTNERNAVARSLLPLPLLLALSDQHVDEMAERGRPRIRTEGDRLVFSHTLEGNFGDQMFARMSWLHPEWTKARLRAEIEAQRAKEIASGAMVMQSTQARDEKLRELDDVLLRLEREEEWLIRDAESEGTIIPRRERAAPLAVLGLRRVPRVRAKAA